ncbi:MAG: ABC transporter ATP-binding protein [Alphaproteobacteria bacterium]|nr:ABC transporter ATP-binding protein [Alphaproteobacteria bacterium]
MTMAAEPLIRLAGVGKVYGNGTLALNGFELTVGRAEFLCLLGASGCGKTTVLRLIAGLGSVSQGRIDWPDGAAPGTAPAGRADIGFVFQEPTLMPWASAFDNVYLPLKLRGISRAAARERVEAMLERVGLAPFANVYPRELSGGMKMRVSIARALITEPSLLLMDEPFAALDEITRGRLNDDLLGLWRGKGWTVLFVTHSVYESVYLATRIAVMCPRPGRIVADLPIEAPYPRREAFRTSTRYNDYCRQVSAALHRAMGEPGP